MSWEVEYTFRESIPVERQIDRYPSLSVELRYDNNGSLKSLLQRLQYPDDADRTMVIHESECRLRLLFQVLEFRYGLPISVSSIATRNVSDAGASAARSIRAGLGVAIASVVSLPADLALSGIFPALPALLYMFNAARQSTGDAEAIRRLYATWEFLESPSLKKKDFPTEARELMYARNFVSHGVKLDRNQAEIKAIEAHIKKPIDVFDEHDPAHMRYIKDQRRAAERFIEDRLKLLL